jgi:hypothetical protein
LKNCYFCDEFASCQKLSYQKETYNIEGNYESIREIGYINWLKEQERKTGENFDNIEYLEKRRSK